MKSAFDLRITVTSIVSLLLLFDFYDLIRFQVVLFELLLLRQPVLVQVGLGSSALLWARPWYNLVAAIILLDQNLVSLSDLDLLLFQRKGNPTHGFIVLEDFALLRAVVVVVDVWFWSFIVLIQHCTLFSWFHRLPRALVYHSKEDGSVVF